MCSRKRERRCAVLLQIREEALEEWCKAETLHDVRVAWGRLGGRTLLHRRGPVTVTGPLLCLRRCNGEGVPRPSRLYLGYPTASDLTLHVDLVE